ncbi:pannexin-1-like isoform X1 [Polypterus senegalus]|uniref:pannexin-1-like isoform X1 n=1 Tax=Polypterus senegalus TaxID=55291 RepID=UPI001966854C|nr:pannexin-1-like isoform X1 [Polypterus senegalus]
MAIAHLATEYVFTDFLLKDPPESKFKGLRLELAVDKIVTYVAVGLPLLLISLAFAQEVSVGTQISCFSPTSFSWRQAAYVDSFCWAAVQQAHASQSDPHGTPLWLHKFFPYVLLLMAVFSYIPSLFWRFTATPHLFADLAFIMEELDKKYNMAIRFAKSFYSSGDTNSSDANETVFKYPLAEEYLKTKKLTRDLVIKYLTCRITTLVIIILACLYLGYYIHLASLTDEFRCTIKTGILKNDTTVPEFLQCKLIAVGVFRVLSFINLIVYIFLAPVIIYATLLPVRKSCDFLSAYSILPTFTEIDLTSNPFTDFTLYLLFLEENLSELKSYKCVKVLELLKENNKDMNMVDIMRNLAQVKMDTVDGKMSNANCKSADGKISDLELQVVMDQSGSDGKKKDGKNPKDGPLRQRLLEPPTTC